MSLAHYRVMQAGRTRVVFDHTALIEFFEPERAGEPIAVQIDSDASDALTREDDVDFAAGKERVQANPRGESFVHPVDCLDPVSLAEVLRVPAGNVSGPTAVSGSCYGSSNPVLAALKPLQDEFLSEGTGFDAPLAGNVIDEIRHVAKRTTAAIGGKP